MADHAVSEFSAFVADSSPRMLWSARLLCGGDRSAAEDLVQDALVETYQRWSRIESPDARYAYARQVMVRMATRRWRAASRLLETVVSAVPEHAHADHAAGRDLAVDVWQALGELSPRQRAVMVLRYYEDLSEAEIARTIGCSRGSVKTHATRALSALATVLSADALDPDSTASGSG